MASRQAGPATARRTVAESPSGQTSSAEPYPANLGPLARPPVDDPRATELIDASPHVLTDLPSMPSGGDPWAPDTVFDAVPLFVSGEKKADASDIAKGRTASRSHVDDLSRPSGPVIPSTQAHAMKGKSTSSFLVDKIVGGHDAASDSEESPPDAKIPQRSTAIPLDDSARHILPSRAQLPTLERATTEPHRAPDLPTATESAPAARASGKRGARAGDKTAAKGMRAPIVDDEDLFSEGADPLSDDPDMTMEDAVLPSKAAPSSKP
jgi:hypothetical protein